MKKLEKKNHLSLKDKYEILIRARNFHYENFNKWMSYFYVIIGAIFVSFYFFIKKSDNYLVDYRIELICISIAGFIVSLFWYWANKGYYYWNINFITLVNHYEKNLLKFKEDERIYFVFANKENQNNYINPLSGANISTSKISILLSFIITLFWITFALFLLFTKCITCIWLRIPISLIIGIVIILIFSEVIAKNFLYSYNYHFPDLNIKTTENNNYKPKEEIVT